MRISITAFLMIGVIAAAIGLAAQEVSPGPLQPSMPQPFPPPGPQPPLPDNPLHIVARFLELTPGQVEDAGKLLDSRKDLLEPVLKEIAAMEKDLRELIADKTEPATIGNAVLAIEALRKRAQEINHQFMVDFRQLLTPGQKARLQQLERAARLQPVANAAHTLGLF